MSAATAARRRCGCFIKPRSGPSSLCPSTATYRYLRHLRNIAMETGAVEHAIVIERWRRSRTDQNDARPEGQSYRRRVLSIPAYHNDVVGGLVIRDRRFSAARWASSCRTGHNKRTGKVDRTPEVVMPALGGADITTRLAKCPQDFGQSHRRGKKPTTVWSRRRCAWN